MYLASVLNIDEGALICDLAETYHILNYRELPQMLVATLCFGLRENSRVKMKIQNAEVDLKTVLLASIADKLSTLVWFQSEDGANNVNRPESILNALMNTEKESTDKLSFTTAEAYESYMRSIKEG